LSAFRTACSETNEKGHLDHFGVDLKGHRLFVTPEDYKAVLVYDLHEDLRAAAVETLRRSAINQL
jgi:hypothetical protein